MFGFVAPTLEFLGDVRNELRKITWPSRDELRRSTIAILLFVLAIAAFIALIDVILNGVLVRAIPALFGR